MTETFFRSIVNNNLGLFKSNHVTLEQAIENIVTCIYEKPKLKCPFGDYCTVSNGDHRPCDKCRKSFEHELSED